MPGQSGRRRRDGGRSRLPDSTASGSGSANESETPRTAADLFKDAQTATTELKTLLQSVPPWSREADAIRTRARNTYLAVVFHHPLSPQAQSLDSLWLGTTYTLISSYRDVVARIEAVLPLPANRRKQGQDAAGDLRRTLAKFRSALAGEDTFYRSLVSRIVGFYKLQDRAGSSLALVGIPTPTPTPATETSSTLSREESEKKLQLVYKGLICLGDLERYKEQYTDKARRDARDGVNPKEVKFEKAIMYYEVARGLQPDNGTAFNQLAVIDGYVGDSFHCTYHYYRALAVRQPFPSGDVNLERVLKRAFDRWRAQRGEEGGAGGVGVGGEGKGGGAEGFRRDLLSACAILHLRAGTSHFTPLYEGLIGEFAHLVHTRQLPSETIVKTTAMVIGAHWCARLGKGDPEDEDKARRRRNVEELALKFLLGVFGALIKTAGMEVTESLAARKDDDESAIGDDDEATDATMAFAQRITAVLRRILPSLRIMSRWLKSHLEYLGRLTSEDVRGFWGLYKQFMLSLAQLFPLIQLPSLEGPLEEDIDMRGFLPLRRSGEESGDAPERQDVHPNEEQLMRIADLLVDVKLIMQVEAGAAALTDGPPMPTELFGSDASVSTEVEVEDDPVNLAMRATLNEGGSVVDEEEEEEVIMWERTPVASGTETSTAQDLLQNLTLAAPPPSGLLFGDSIWSMSREESQKGKARAAAAAWHSDDKPPVQAQQAHQQQQPQQQQHVPHPPQHAQHAPHAPHGQWQQQYQHAQRPSPSLPPGLNFQSNAFQPQHLTGQLPRPQSQHQSPQVPPGFAPGFNTPPGFTTPPHYTTPPGVGQAHQHGQHGQQWPRSRPQSGNNIWGAPAPAPVPAPAPGGEGWGGYQQRQWGYQ